MRREFKSLVTLASGLLLTAVANAACYTVIDAKGAIVSQTSTPPVDMSQQLRQTVPARYGRGARMVFGLADENCGPPAEPFQRASVAQQVTRPAKPDRG